MLNLLDSLWECKGFHWLGGLGEVLSLTNSRKHLYRFGGNLNSCVCFLPQGFRASPRHIRRRVAAAAAARLEEVKPVVEVHHQSEQESSGRKRRIKKISRVQPEFYHSVQGASTRRPVSRELPFVRVLLGYVVVVLARNDSGIKSGSLLLKSLSA